MAEADHPPDGETTPGKDGPPCRKRTPPWNALLGSGVLLLAGIVRLIHLSQWRTSPFYDHPILDAGFFHRLATGEIRFPGQAYQWNPLYPWFLETIYAVFGTAPTGPVLIQLTLGAVNAQLCFLLTLRVFRSRLAAAAAGLLAAFYAPFLFFEGVLLAPSVILFLVLVLLLLWSWGRTRPLAFLPAGAVLGAACLARGNLLALFPFLLLWPLLFERSWGLRLRLGAAAAVLAGFAAVILPVTLRNAAREPGLVLTAAHGGVNFYIGNGSGATGTYRPVFAGPHGLAGQIRKARQAASREEGRPLTASEASSFYYGKALREMTDRPGRALAHFLHKSRLLINRSEVPLNYNYEFQKRYSFVLRGPLPGFGLLLPLALMGAGLAWLDRRQVGHLFLYAGIYGATVVLFFISSRYRLPVTAALLPLAGYGIVRFVEAIRGWELTRSLSGAALLLLGAALVILPVGEDASEAASYRALGSILASEKNVPGAEAAYRSAMALDPGSSAGANNLGKLFLDDGRSGEARSWLEKAVALDRANVQAWNNLGVCLQNLGDGLDAEEAYLTAIRVEPGYATPYRNLARLYVAHGDRDSARAVLERLRALQEGRGR